MFRRFRCIQIFLFKECVLNLHRDNKKKIVGENRGKMGRSIIVTTGINNINRMATLQYEEVGLVT